MSNVVSLQYQNNNNSTIMDKYSDSSVIFAKMQDIISVKELNRLFPNGAISFVIQLNRGNAIALQLYQSIKNL